MGFLELASQRFSVRSFSDKPVEQEKTDKILKAAQLAPTAVNFQPQMIPVRSVMTWSKSILPIVRRMWWFWHRHSTIGSSPAF